MKPQTTFGLQRKIPMSLDDKIRKAEKAVEADGISLSESVSWLQYLKAEKAKT